MTLVSAALGIIAGTLCFTLAGYSLFIPALIVMSLATLAFSSYARYQKQILLCLLCVLLSFFNYHLRADWLEIQDYTKLLNSGKYELEIISKPRANPYFETEFIVELKKKHGVDLKSLFVPYRLLAQTSLSRGLELGDIIELDKRKNPKTTWKTEKLNDFKAQVLRKDKVFMAIKNKNLSYVRHKTNPIESMQKWIRSVYESQLSHENAEIVTSLILGSRVAKVPEEFNGQIRNLGLTHIFAASGFNLLIISVTLTWLFGLLKLGLRTSSIAIILGSILYTAVAGFSPSIVRACIFITVFSLLKLAGRKPLSLRFLVILTAIMLAIDPYTIFDIGFQLSYLATLALILFASPIQARTALLIPKVPKYYQEIISTGIAVQLVLMPLIIYYFHSAQIWALAANILFTPFITLIIILAVIGLGFIIEPLMNLFKYLLALSEHLPFIDSRLELDFNSYLLLTILFIYLAYLLGKTEDGSSKLRNKYLASSLCASLLVFLLAGNAPPLNVESVDIFHGQFKGKYAEPINQFLALKDGPCYKYTEVAGLKTLIIKGKRNLSCMNELDGNLEETQLLILPKLNAGDLYLDTLLSLTRPQFIIANIAKDSSRAQLNADIISSYATFVLNSGKLYVGRKKFWSIASYE